MGKLSLKNIISETPIVSVCMITYNQASYICEAIEGVLMQKTNYPFELIISDDCSQDETRSICIDYEKRYPDKVKLFFPKQNLGISENFYSTLFNATGKYIAFCEGDDYWIDPCKIQHQVDFLESNLDVGCVYTDFNMYHQQTDDMELSLFHTRPEHFPLHTTLESFICHPLYVAPCTWMFRKELLVQPPFHSVDATFMLFAHMLSQTKIHYLPDTTAVYRDLPESASHTASLDKLYKRVSGLHMTQIFLVNLYELPQNSKKIIDEFYYSTYLRLITLWGSLEEIKEARFVLKGTKIKLAYRIRLHILRTRLGRWIVSVYCRRIQKKMI